MISDQSLLLSTTVLNDTTVMMGNQQGVFQSMYYVGITGE